MPVMKTSLFTKNSRIKSLLADYIAPYLKEILAVSFFINLLALAVPVFVLQVYDRVVFHAGITTLKGLVIGMIFVVLFDYVMKMTRARFFQSVAARCDIRLTDALFTKLFALPLRTLEQKGNWHWQSLFDNAGVIRNVLSGNVAALAVDLPFAILFLMLIIYIAPPLAWVVLVSLALFLVLAIVSEKMIQRAAGEESRVQHIRSRLMSDLLGSRETVKMLDLHALWKEQWDEKHTDVIRASLVRGRHADFYRILAQSMTITFTVAMTTIGAIAILEQELTIGALIAVNMLGTRLIGPLVQLVEHWRTFMQFANAVHRLDEFLQLDEGVTGTVELPTGEGVLQLKQLTFSYDEDKQPVIQGLDGNIGPKGLHVVMGPNGSGKSTLLKLLSGFYAPGKGKVMLDSADLKQFSTGQLHKRIAYLPQKPELFHGTIYDNIRMGDRQAGEQEVIAAAQQTLLHEQIIKLAEGYDTQVLEGGKGLSGGMLQRIALARTMLGTPGVILLDEPTNNLDREAEHALATRLKELAHEVTVVIATHSPLLLSAADSILVLADGKVAIAGPATKVLQKLGYMDKQVGYEAP
jgi:ATP-binding cassette subfamily C protein LapB